MEKQNIHLFQSKDLEVMCTRPFFGYRCDFTPNNCTECPIMRFMYEDLITNVLTEDSAAKLKKLVEDSQAFSGKYDGEKSLPPEVWNAVYAIRDAFYQCFRLFYTKDSKEEECYQRFVKWFGKHGQIAALPVGRFCVKQAMEKISAGKWLLMDPGDLYHEHPAIEEFSGTYIPTAFDNAETGMQYVIEYLTRQAYKIHPAFTEKNCTVAIRMTDKSATFQTIELYLVPAPDMIKNRIVWLPTEKECSPVNARVFTGWKPTDEEFAALILLMQQAGRSLVQVDDYTESTYRALYLEKVRELQPDIEFDLNISD